MGEIDRKKVSGRPQSVIKGIKKKHQLQNKSKVASTTEKSQNLLVVRCLCLLSISFRILQRKRYPRRKGSYGNRKWALLIHIYRLILFMCHNRLRHCMKTVFLFTGQIKADGDDWWRNLCIFQRKHVAYWSKTSPAPQTQTSFSPAPLGSWRRTAATRHKRSACLYSSEHPPASKLSAAHIYV